uniref:Alanine--glyoxylate aminotransferase 2, mitochondrial n=1 Tax=Cacopsylla melanoneura TaxID=428564 RepID=A0A8D8YAR2_9HEMI
MHGVSPDIVTMAKGIANGFPMGAVATTTEIAQVLTKASHFNTFGGNPVSCAAASAVLDVIKDEELQSNCKEVIRIKPPMCVTMEDAKFTFDVLHYVLTKFQNKKL